MQLLLLRSSVVCCPNCSCGSFYIGQTRRNLKSTMEEHSLEAKFSYKTDVTKSLLDSMEHTGAINFEHPEILALALSLNKLLIKETILIQQYLGQMLTLINNILCLSLFLITDFYFFLFRYTSFFLVFYYRIFAKYLILMFILYFSILVRRFRTRALGTLFYKMNNNLITI